MTPSTLPVTITLTPTPDVLPIPTAEEATRRAVYEAEATSVAAGGQITLEPYETIWARETAIYAERTQYYENQFTPTPFGPIPFPGTRLTDAELAERGWPRMLEDGQRNSDFRTSAIWLDKAYVDAEIFSQYQALFELLAFRDGPPGEDFEARLRELMLPSEPYAALVDEVLQDDPDNTNLVSCTFEKTLANVQSLRDAGAYVYVVPDRSDEVLTWKWVKRIPVETHRDKAIAFQLGSDYVLLLDFHLQGPFDTYSRPGYFKETRSVAADRVMAEWRGEYFPLRIDSNAVLVWSQKTSTWRFLKYASPYCGSVYPESIQR